MKANTKRGLTLTELILAIALLGVIFIAFQDIFVNGFRTIFISGQRTQAIFDAQEIIDDFSRQSFGSFEDLSDYLQTRGYMVVNEVSNDINSVEIYYGKSVNCFIDDGKTLNGIYGYPVYVVSFFANAKQHVQLTTFVIDGD